jgi:hypothetical protein
MGNRGTGGRAAFRSASSPRVHHGLPPSGDCASTATRSSRASCRGSGQRYDLLPLRGSGHPFRLGRRRRVTQQGTDSTRQAGKHGRHGKSNS